MIACNRYCLVRCQRLELWILRGAGIVVLPLHEDAAAPSA